MQHQEKVSLHWLTFCTNLRMYSLGPEGVAHQWVTDCRYENRWVVFCRVLGFPLSILSDFPPKSFIRFPRKCIVSATLIFCSQPRCASAELLFVIVCAWTKTLHLQRDWLCSGTLEKGRKLNEPVRKCSRLLEERCPSRRGHQGRTREGRTSDQTRGAPWNGPAATKRWESCWGATFKILGQPEPLTYIEFSFVFTILW